MPWLDVVSARGVVSASGSAAAGAGPRPLDWHDFPGGTGAMIDAIEAGAIDIAILLTEGAVAGLARGGGYRIVSNYVTSPLIWGVHVAPASPLQAIDEIAGARFAVSRLGSGSHLMALALATERGWTLRADQFVVVGSLDGAIDAFRNDTADVFMWEHFMTQPVVDRGQFRRIGDFVAPWSAFVTCARADLWAAEADELRSLIDEVGESARRFAQDPATPERIHAAYGIAEDQIREWLSRTRWAAGFDPPEADLAAAGAMLREAGLIAGQ